MDEKYKNWCRLCAKSEGCSKNLLSAEDIFPTLRLTIEKHFTLQIESTGEAPTTICDECHEYLMKLIAFEETVYHSQSTFECPTPNEKEIEISPFYEFEEELHTQEENEQPYHCTQCDHQFKTDTDLTDHVKSHAGCIPAARLSCDICGGNFKTSFSLRNHQKLVHSSARPFICDECGKAFKRAGDLTRHKEFHQDETPFACSICGKMFSSKLVVKMHEKTHNEENFVCNVCGKELKSTHTLRGHMQTHSDEMHFECKYCDKKFRYKKNLNCHLLTHTGLQPFSCGFCNKAFSLRWNCRTHLRKVHPVELAEEGRTAIITNIVKQKFSCGRRQVRDAVKGLDEMTMLNVDGNI